MTIEQIILDWLRHNGHTWGAGPGALIAELAAHGYEIVEKDKRPQGWQCWQTERCFNNDSGTCLAKCAEACFCNQGRAL